MRLASAILLAFLAGATAACSGPDGAPEASTGEPHTFAVLYGTREQVLAPALGEPFVDVGLGARVVRHAGIDRATVSEVLEMTAYELAEIPPDECSEPLTAATLDDLAGIEPGAFVELVDVGALEVRAAGAVERLDPRSFPDLLSVVAGVVYAGEDDGRLGLEAGSEVTFFAPGGGGIRVLEGTAAVPEEITSLRVGGETSSLGPATVSRGAELDVSWDAGGAGDEIQIELSWNQPAGTVVVACRATDDGAFRIPGDRTRLLPELEDALVTVRRVRRTPVAADGLDDGDLVLQQAVTRVLRAQ